MKKTLIMQEANSTRKCSITSRWCFLNDSWWRVAVKQFTLCVHVKSKRKILVQLHLFHPRPNKFAFRPSQLISPNQAPSRFVLTNSVVAPRRITYSNLLVSFLATLPKPGSDAVTPKSDPREEGHHVRDPKRLRRRSRGKKSAGPRPTSSRL